MDAAVKDEAKAFPNITVISTDAKGDVAKLTSNVEDLLSQKVDGLIISGAWIEAAPEALDAIKAAAVPVVLVDRGRCEPVSLIQNSPGSAESVWSRGILHALPVLAIESSTWGFRTM